MIVTKEIIESGMSANGGWNLAQLKALLLDSEFLYLRPGEFPKKGWKSRIIGTDVKKEQIDKFLRLKNAHIEEKTPLFAGMKA